MLPGSAEGTFGLDCGLVPALALRPEAAVLLAGRGADPARAPAADASSDRPWVAVVALVASPRVGKYRQHAVRGAVTVSGTRGGHMSELGRPPWAKPELIVLVRNTSGEAVLTACKSELLPLEGPNPVNQSCTSVLSGCDPPYCAGLTES